MNKSADERLTDLERQMQVVEESLLLDTQFKEEMRGGLKEIKERNGKADQFIDSELEARNLKAQFWRNVTEKVVTAGIWSALVFIAGAVLLTMKEYFKSGGG